MTGNSRISNRNFSEGTVLILYQSPVYLCHNRAPNATTMNKKVKERSERQKSKVSKRQTWKDREMVGTEVHDMKFPKNQFVKKLC